MTTVGQKVAVTGGAYKGQQGVVVAATPKRIRLRIGTDLRTLAKGNLHFFSEDEEESAPAAAPPKKTQRRRVKPVTPKSKPSAGRVSTAATPYPVSDKDPAEARACGEPSVLWDPSVLFALSILVFPAVKAQDASLLLAVVENVAFWCCLIAFFGAKVWAGPATRPMTAGDWRAARWYLINAVFFHSLCDFFAGGMGFLEPLANEMVQQDCRFKADHDLHSVPFLVSAVELFVMAPLCLMAYRSVVQGRSDRDMLEVVVASLQVFGMIVFAGMEVLAGMPNIPCSESIKAKAMQFDFGLDEAAYFWFAFVFANLVWLVVPGKLGWDAYVRGTSK